MHLYVAMRGMCFDQDRFLTEMKGQYLPLTFTHVKTGKKVVAQNQIGVRPIVLYEFSFPEESKDIALTTILGDAQILKKDSKFKKFVWGLRKLLRADKIPEYKQDRKLPVYKDNLQIIGIGTKKDEKTKVVINGEEYEVEGI